MAGRVSKSRFKARALEYFRQVEATGEPVVITDHGQDKLEIHPYKSEARDPLDILRGSVLHYADRTAPVGDDDWEADEKIRAYPHVHAIW